MSISRPSIKESGFGAYTLTWEVEQVAMRVERLREDSAGHVSGEVRVVTTLPGASQHLHQAHFNLSSTAARNTLAKYLHARVELDWPGVLEQMCALVLEAYRMGESIQAAGNEEVRSSEEQYLLEPLLPKGLPTIFFGPGGVGKSYLALYCALVTRVPLYNTDLLPHDDGPVLYLDYETDFAGINDRIARLKKGVAAGVHLDDTINYRFCSRPITADLPEIQRATAELQPKLIIVDSVGSACGITQGDPAEPVLRLFAALRSLRTTVLLIDHVPQENGHRPYGSVYKINQARSIWEIRSTQEAGDNTLDIGLYHRKANTSRLLPPIGLSLQFSAEAVSVTSTSVRDIPALASGLGIADQVHGILLHGAMDPKDIAEALTIDSQQVSAASVRTILNRNKKRFIKQPSGIWGILEQS